MADPRFFRNHGPFTLASICEKAGLAPPAGADGARLVRDLAGLDGAGPEHLTFYAGGKELRDAYAQTKAGVCLVPLKDAPQPPIGTVAVACESVSHVWAVMAGLFYPDIASGQCEQDAAIHPSATLGQDVRLEPGVTIGPGAEIGGGCHVGAGAVIGPGVAMGRNCGIGANAVIGFCYLGDAVMVGPCSVLGRPGFGYAQGAGGFLPIPQLGRVIVQDRVEIGANSCMDRGALGDTVIGEGTKIDNQVQIAHNVRIGRHCIIAAQAGIGGSSVVEDFVVVGEQVGISDHCHIGAGARLAPRTAVAHAQTVAGSKDHDGQPAKPLTGFSRDIPAVGKLANKKKFSAK